MKLLQLAMLLAMTGTAAAAGKDAPAPTGAATTGQQETPLGLYIIPWRNADAKGGTGRPARLLDEALRPHDAEVFGREVEYYRALSEHLEKTGKLTP